MGLVGFFGRESFLVDMKKGYSDFQGRLRGYEWRFVNFCFRQIKVMLEAMEKTKFQNFYISEMNVNFQKKKFFVFEFLEKK